MATQIQTTAGVVAKAYEAKVVELQRLYDLGTARYEAAKAAWQKKSSWYRFWHRSKQPFSFDYVNGRVVVNARASHDFYEGLSPETLVFVDEDTAMWLRLDYVRGDGIDGR